MKIAVFLLLFLTPVLNCCAGEETELEYIVRFGIEKAERFSPPQSVALYRGLPELTADAVIKAGRTIIVREKWVEPIPGQLFIEKLEITPNGAVFVATMGTAHGPLSCGIQTTLIYDRDETGELVLEDHSRRVC